MIKYVAFLHGANVRDKKPLNMEDLIRLFELLKLKNVRIYQSSNVIFETEEKDNEALTKRIEVELYKSLGYDAGIFLRTIPEIEALVKKITAK